VKDDTLDQFYTKKEIALSLISKTLELIPNYKNYIFLEPSAGNGAFYHQLPEPKIALDIEPKSADIIKMDFSDFKPLKEKYICIGNPPFGKKGWKALQFILKAKSFCEYVCFILPMNFNSNGKGCPRNTVEKYFELIYSQELGYDSFVDKTVNCVFQIWKKTVFKSIQIQDPINEYIDIYTVDNHSKRTCGLDKLDKYQYFIDNTFYSIEKPKKNIDLSKRFCGYGIIIKKNYEEISKLLEETNWNKYSHKATNNCYHINSSHINKVLLDYFL
jgi:predicted RNA methylase